MNHSAYTPKLSAVWDLELDAGGNLILSKNLDAIAQNVANECRLFKNDAYFRFEDGTDWFSLQLGEKLNKSLVTSQLRKSAESVAGVDKVIRIAFNEFDIEARKVSGQIDFLTKEGEHGSIGF